MGRPPSGGGSQPFRFLPNELAKLEKVWQESRGSIPSEKILQGLVEKFSKAREQDGKMTVKRGQVSHWFQNRRWYIRKKEAEKQTQILPKENLPSRVEATSSATLPDEIDITKMEFEAKSSKDGAWYDVHAFLGHRMLNSGDPEVRVRFVGYGAEDDEWVNVKAAIRQRSVPYESSECISVLPGEIVLCFQEANKQALYYDACVVDVERRKHDIRGCRCKFVVQYEHSGSMGILPLKKLCRRPEAERRPIESTTATNSSKQTSDLCQELD